MEQLDILIDSIEIMIKKLIYYKLVIKIFQTIELFQSVTRTNSGIFIHVMGIINFIKLKPVLRKNGKSNIKLKRLQKMYNEFLKIDLKHERKIRIKKTIQKYYNEIKQEEVSVFIPMIFLHNHIH